MRILVLVKPVPDPDKYNEIKIDPETKRIARQDAAAVMDPVSRNALEEALLLRDDIASKTEEPSSVTVLSMTPETSRDKIMECLAMGADSAYLASDPAFGGADTFATSYVLARGIERIAETEGIEGFDLILAGHESADGATCHVAVQVAEWLKLPHACGARRIEVCGAPDETVIKVIRKTEDAILEMEAPAPAVVSVARDSNRPRHISAMGIVKARKKPLIVWNNADLELDPLKTGLAGSPTVAGKLITPDLSRASRALTEAGASAEDAAKALLSLIRKAGLGI